MPKRHSIISSQPVHRVYEGTRTRNRTLRLESFLFQLEVTVGCIKSKIRTSWGVMGFWCGPRLDELGYFTCFTYVFEMSQNLACLHSIWLYNAAPRLFSTLNSQRYYPALKINTFLLRWPWRILEHSRTSAKCTGTCDFFRLFDYPTSQKVTSRKVKWIDCI